jgi:hypothetical protein
VLSTLVTNIVCCGALFVSCACWEVVLNKIETCHYLGICSYLSVQSIPNELKEDYEVSMITLEYRREAGKGDKVDSLARREPCDVNNDISALEGLSQLQFIHLIRNQEGDEINRGRTVWRHVKHAAKHQGEISP